MSVIADFSIPADQFALGHLLEVRPGVQVRLESMVPTGEAMIPYFWVEDPDIEAVEAALLESEYVEDATIVDRVGNEALFRVVWAEHVDGVVDTIRETESVILGGNGHGDHWTFELRFPEYDALSQFYRSVVDKGVSITLENVHNPIDQTRPRSNALTEEQREALQTALKEGYFAVPRDITLVELAEKLGISDSAVSQRIRRGLTKLLTTNLAGQ
jgi:predicted DNA binding protein